MASIKTLQKAMDHASSYDEWKEAAIALDAKTGADRWKFVEQSRQYDYVSIRTRLNHLRTLRDQGDFRGLLYGVVRNVARRYEERAAKALRRSPDQSA